MIIELTREPLQLESILRRVENPDCGAVVTFLGVVRKHHHGREVLRLDYTAYEAMALAQMRRLGEELRERWPLHKVAIVHRLGTLEVGEASIALVLSLAHRQEGFEALRHAIDTFKQTVPIWKKEHFADGEARWVEGS